MKRAQGLLKGAANDLLLQHAALVRGSSGPGIPGTKTDSSEFLQLMFGSGCLRANQARAGGRFAVLPSSAVAFCRRWRLQASRARPPNPRALRSRRASRRALRSSPGPTSGWIRSCGSSQRRAVEEIPETKLFFSGPAACVLLGV